MVLSFDKVIKRDGRVVPFDKEKITSAIFASARAVGGKDRMKAEELSELVVQELERTIKSGYPSIEQIQDTVERVLIEQGHARTAKAYISYRQKRAVIRLEKQRVLERESVDEIDKSFDLNALRVLKSRYLRKSEDGKLIESPKQLFTRVAVHVALPDILYDPIIFSRDSKQKKHAFESFDPLKFEGKISLGSFHLNRYHLDALKRMYDSFNDNCRMKLSWQQLLNKLKEGKFVYLEATIKEFFDLMISKRFLPNTPAIANFGNPLGMGSACFVLSIEDSMEEIMETLKKTALVFKAGGGMGYNFSKLRPEGDFVSTTHGLASGPLSFMRLFDTMTEVIKQGGCVANDTIIRTDKGTMPIGDLLHCRFMGENPTNYFVYDGVDYNHAFLALNNGVSDVYNITTELGTELNATFNHQIATIADNGELVWKRVADLNRGDWLVMVLGGHSGKTVELPPITRTHFNSNEIKMPSILTTELAEIMGLYMADGCMNRGRLIFSFNAEDKELEEKINNSMNNVFGLRVGEKRDSGTYFELVFFSKDLEKYFIKMNWKKEKSLKSFVPSDIFLGDEKIVAAFLRGLFEGDGSIHSDGYPLLYSSSKRLLLQTQQLLFGLEIISRIHHIPVSKIKNHKGKNDMFKLIVLTDRGISSFMKKIGFLSKEKNAKLKHCFKPKQLEYCDLIPDISSLLSSYYTFVGRGCGKNRSKKGADLKYYKAIGHYLKKDRTLTRKKLTDLRERFEFLKSDKTINKLVDEKYFFTRIAGIENSIEASTMEIEVPASGCYVGNSILVHNIRRGANMGILNSNHPDIEHFIKAKEGNKALKNFNISVMVMPEFWDCLEKNKPYPLLNPRNGQVIRTINSQMLFDLIVHQAWESAEPGLIYFDHVNNYNPMLEAMGPILSTNPCVSADTLVSTENGLERIDSIKSENIAVDCRTIDNSNSLNSVNLQKGVEFVKPSQIIKTGFKECFKLVTDSGYELTATADHRILTESGWKQLIELNENDNILIQSGKGMFNLNAKLSFKVKNEIIGLQGRNYCFNLPSFWSEALGLVIGWLVGDGWLNTKNNTLGLVFSKADDDARQFIQPIFEEYCDAPRAEANGVFSRLGFRRKPNIENDEMGAPLNALKYMASAHPWSVSDRQIKLSNLKQSCRQVRTNSKVVIDFFSKLGVKSSEEEREVPESIFTATEEGVCGFLSGLFSADGTIALGSKSRNYVRLNSSSIKLLKGVQLLLLNLGIYSSIYDCSTKPKTFSYTKSSGENVEYKTSGINFELNISKENIPKFLSKVKFIQSRHLRKTEKLKEFEFYSEHFFDNVKSIEFVGKKEVWDITENRTHSFIANGFVVHNCGEVVLYPNESCNLGSINAWNFVHETEKDGMEFDWSSFEKTIWVSTKFLDNIIDVNKFPLPEIEEMTLSTRKIGLGLMGLGDLLYALDLPYDSDKGLKFMEKLMEFINYHSKLASIELAKSRGAFPTFNKSFYPKGRMPFAGFDDKSSWNVDWNKVVVDVKKFGLRNCFTTVIAPTGSISMIAGCSSGIEPVYSLVFEKHVNVGSFYYVNPVFEKIMSEEGLFDDDLLEDVVRCHGSIKTIAYIPPKFKKLFVTAHDISPEDHIKALATFQKWVDSSISKTINFPADATVDGMKKCYILAHKLGCKDVTIFRDTSIKDQVLVTAKKKKEIGKQLIASYTDEERPAETLEAKVSAQDNGGVQALPQVEKKFCPNDGSLLVMKEGCMVCPICGWGICSGG